MVRRAPRDGKPHFTIMSLHNDSSYAKKSGIVKNVLDAVRTAMQQVDMVAGDFNGAACKSLEKVEVKGIVGWQRLEREARGCHGHRVALLTESLTHPERVLKITDLWHAFYRWEGSLKEFQCVDQLNWMTM